MTIPIILDVDTGVDDALALGLAVLEPEIELLAASTLAGNVDVGQTTRNTLTVLDWFGATELPVHRGASRPLARPLHTAERYHGSDGLGESGLEPSQRPVGPDRGPAAMIRLARSRPGDITLVCVGPLTNLAIALNVEPSLPDLVAGLVIMGGAYHVPGNTTPQAEFNIYCDPEAAAQVFEVAERFKRFTAIGLDVCHQVALGAADYRASQTAASPGARLFARIGRRTFEERKSEAFYLYDPLALAVAVRSELVRNEDSTVIVDLDEEHRGRTRIAGPGPVQVARSVDVEAFMGWARAVLDLPAI